MRPLGTFLLWGLLLAAPLASPQASPPSAAPGPADKTEPAGAPPSALTPEAEAWRHFLRGELPEAEHDYRALLAKTPGSGTAHAGLVWTLLESEALDKAAEEVSAGLQASPDSAELLAAAGDLAFRQGDFGGAEKLYKRALDATGNNARGYAGMARLARAVSKNKVAKQFADRAYDRDATDPEIVGIYAATRSKRSERAALLEKHLGTAGYLAKDERDEERTAIATMKSLGDSKLYELASPRIHTELHLEELNPQPHHREGWGLRVSLNGSKPATMLLDSGASGVTIGRKLAARCGIQPLREGTVSGIGDGKPVRSHGGLAERLSVGSVELRNVPVDIVDENSIADRDGIIGPDVFAEFLITLDFAGRKVKLEPLLPRPGEQPGEPTDRQITPELKGFVPVYRFGHMLLIPVHVGKEATGLFLIDTGAATNLVSNAMGRKITKVARDHDVRVKGISGEVKEVFNADKVEMEFAGFRQQNNDMLAFDFSKLNRSTGTEISGVMGRPVLDFFAITFDYRDGLVKLEYRGVDASVIPQVFR